MGIENSPKRAKLPYKEKLYAKGGEKPTMETSKTSNTSLKTEANNSKHQGD